MFAFAEAASEQPRCVLGGMDTAMRSCLKPNIQTFSISFERFEEMISFADKTFLDTYIWQPLKNRLSMCGCKSSPTLENMHYC